MNLDSLVFWFACLTGCVVVIAGFTLFARWAIHSPAVSDRKLERLQVGMTTSDVTALLGAPRQKRSGEQHEAFWIYGSQWKRHVLIVEFNGETMREFVHGVPQIRKRKRTESD